MNCQYLKAFNGFQKMLIEKEARESKKDPEEIAQGWVDANSNDVRKVFCEKLCPLRETCERR